MSWRSTRIDLPAKQWPNTRVLQVDVRLAFREVTCPIHLGGFNYAPVSLDWLLGPFAESYQWFLKNQGDDAWKARWACREFARAYAMWAQMANAKGTPPDSTEDSAFVGEIWFLPDPINPNQGHAICPAYTDKGRVFIDPQAPSVLYPMSDAQLRSAYFLRI